MAKAIGPRITAAVKSSFQAAFATAVVPAFERGMQSMFEQVRVMAAGKGETMRFSGIRLGSLGSFLRCGTRQTSVFRKTC